MCLLTIVNFSYFAFQEVVKYDSYGKLIKNPYHMLNEILKGKNRPTNAKILYVFLPVAVVSLCNLVFLHFEKFGIQGKTDIPEDLVDSVDEVRFSIKCAMKVDADDDSGDMIWTTESETILLSHPFNLSQMVTSSGNLPKY